MSAAWKCLKEDCGYEGNKFGFDIIHEHIQFPNEEYGCGHADIGLKVCCPKCKAASLAPLPLTALDRMRRYATEEERNNAPKSEEDGGE